MEKYYLYAIVLATTYLGYYIVSKFLLRAFSLTEILFQAYALTFIAAIVLFHKDVGQIVEKFHEIDPKYYLGILVLAALMMTCSCFSIYAAKSNINYGKIDSLAHAIYLPIVTLVSVFLFKNAIKPIEYVGIGLIALGACLIHTI